MTPNDPKRTSFMRYDRVHAILRSDNALSRRLGKETVAVCKPDQTHVDFPSEVVRVTDEIHSQGIDAYTMPKIEVIRLAHRLLVKNSTPSVPAPVPAPTSAPAPDPATDSVPVQAASPAPQKAARKPRTPKVVQTARQEVVPKPSADVQPSDPVSKKLPPEFVRPYAPYVVGVAALSNLQAVLTLFEPFMDAGGEDAKAVCQKVNALIDDIHRRTVLPSHAEKEPADNAS